MDVDTPSLALVPKVVYRPATEDRVQRAGARPVLRNRLTVHDEIFPLYPSSLLLCKQLFDYKLMDTLGKGAFGTVYLARSYTGKDYAIKVIKRSSHAWNNLFAHKEQRLLSKLTDEKSLSFVKLEESFHDPMNYYIVTVGFLYSGTLGY